MAHKIKLYSLEHFIEAVTQDQKENKKASKYYGVSPITLSGFKATMKSRDMEYVFDQTEYVDALDKYLK